MLILAIDTSTKVGAVAIYSQDKGVIAEVILNCGNNHSENIMNAVDGLFKISKYSIKDIDKVAVSIGPGSFTGIRIGVGIAKGLAYSLGKPIIGVNTLDIIANLSTVVDNDIKVISMIDARKERVYYGVYNKLQDNLELEKDYCDGEIREILTEYKNNKVLFLGDGAINYKKIIKEEMGGNAFFAKNSLSIPRASILAEISLGKENNNLITLEPYYISKSQAERKVTSEN